AAVIRGRLLPAAGTGLRLSLAASAAQRPHRAPAAAATAAGRGSAAERVAAAAIAAEHDRAGAAAAAEALCDGSDRLDPGELAEGPWGPGDAGPAERPQP